MIASSAVEHTTSFRAIEALLTVVVIGIAFCCPRAGSRWFRGAERVFLKLVRRKRTAVLVVGLATLLSRFAILPLVPAPHPFLHDDFSFLLAAKTFASGRLTNPTPAMWTHFETFHLTMVPTYMSMYFPGEGLVLAAGKVLTGHYWYGVVIMGALMCAGICWALQQWLPPGWALLGGILCMLRIALFSNWVNSYSTAATIAALGGALVIGALPRLTRWAKIGDGLLMAIGMSLLMLSRPYEGMLLCLPVAFVLGRWAFFKGKNRPPAAVLMRRAALPLLIIIGTGAWLGYYDYRAFGSPLTPPYKLDRQQYAIAPYFVWQPLRPAPHYRHPMMQRFYEHGELRGYKQFHSLRGFLPVSLERATDVILFFTGFALLPPIIMIRRVVRDRRMRFLLICTVVMIVGLSIETFMLVHYLAPFTVLFYALGLQAMRHLRHWKPMRQPVGGMVVRLCVLLCVALAGVRLYAEPLHLIPPKLPAVDWAANWYGPGPYGERRAGILARLDRAPGKDLVIVKYANDHNPVDQWIYNGPDLNTAKVIWAWDMGPAQNLALIHCYSGRKVWLVQPDTTPVKLTPYPVPESQDRIETAQR